MKKALLILMCMAAMMTTCLSLNAQEVTITLNPGWTWISIPNVDTLDFETALGAFTPANGDIIKSQWSNASYINGQWRGPISQFYPGYGYMYKSNRPMPVTVTFTAQQPVPQVVVTTSEPMLVTANSAMGGGVVNTSDGNYVAIQYRGICWGVNPNPTLNDNYLELEGGIGSFTASMTNLNLSTTYYIRAYAVTADGTYYGEQKTFTTRDGIPTLTTAEVTNIQGATATCGGNITDNGGLNVTARGVCWSTSPTPTIADSHTTNGSGLGSFSSSVTGLNVSTTYYMRAYATTSAGTGYGEEKTFTTKDGIPTLTTAEVTDITGATATCGGNITDNGGLNITARGVCWSTSPDPTIADSHTTNGSGSGSFSSSIMGLNVSTTYYVRAYATTASGIAYGDEKIFITRDGIPTLSTFDVIDIGYTSAMCGGNISDDGGLEVTARGVCWSTLPNPTLADTYTINGAGIGEFTSSITGLNVNTTYYVRAYASNNLFTAYGDEISFTTIEVFMDTITVMQYNLLQYGNYNSGFSDCFESNNNTLLKDASIRTILNYVQPDILTVNEFGATQELLTSFLNNNLNIGGIDYWQSDNIINYAGSNIINHIFYDSRKFGLKKHIALQTNPRDTDVYELFLKTPGLDVGDTIKLVCIVAHPKAGQSYQANRRALMQQAMDYVNQYYSTENVLIMGDFNMYGASESGYQLLTQTYSNQEVRFIDPVAVMGGVGEWNNNSQFAQFHTQSTRSYSEECFSGGGLDDRFDFILMSDEIDLGNNNLDYVQNSYKAIGNDGNHFNMSIDQGGNTSVPGDVLNALFDGSDHLPITMKIAVFDNSKK